MNNEDSIFSVEIAERQAYINGGNYENVRLDFPTDKDTVIKAFQEIGISPDRNPDNYVLKNFQCGNEDLTNILSAEPTSIDELNYLANRISELEDIEMTAFQAAIKTKHCENIKDAINITYNTECYNVVPDMYSWSNVGAYIAECEGLGIEVLGGLSEYIDYATYGRAYANDNGGYLLNDIYLETNLADFTVKYNGEIENIPPEYIVTEYGESVQRDYDFDVQFEASKDLAVAIDSYMRSTDSAYAAKYPDDFERLKYFSDCLLDKSTLALKDMLTATSTLQGDALVDKICDFEHEYPCDKYMIYQLKDGDETRDYRFNSYSQLEKQGLTVNKDNYEQTYVHYLSEDTTLEDLYTRFNIEIPQDFKGHSMSVSDIVVLQRNGEEKAYYCDSEGFVEVPEFFEEQAKQITPDELMTGEQIRTPRGSFYVTDMTAEQMKEAGYGIHHMSDDGKYLIMGNGTRAFAVAAEQPEKQNEINETDNSTPPEKEDDQPQSITVLVVEPLKEPYTKEIPNTLEALQNEVGGLIAHMYPSEKPIALICNDEGKINGMRLNRAIYDTEGEMYDIVAGTFVIAGIDNERLTSLSPDLQRQFTNRFRNPEIFIKVNGEIQAVPVKPSIKAALGKLKKEQGRKNEPQKKPPNQEL